MLNDSICNLTLAIACAIVDITLLPNSSEAQPVQSGLNSSEARLVNDPVETEGVRAEWEKDFIRLGMKGRISNCRLMLQVFYEGMKDKSYGAVCSFDGGNQPRDILICDDTLVGKLTIKAWGYAESEPNVLSFTKANCPAGG